MIRWASNHQTDGCKTYDESYERYATYPCVTAYFKAKPKAAEKGQRLAINIEYTDTDPFQLDLPGDNFSFSLAASQKWIGSLIYERELRGVQIAKPSDGGEESARLGLEASYEDVTGDPMRQSRLVATATLTQRLTKCTALSVSAVYANKPEYLGMVDEEVSTRFGFRWGQKELEGCMGASSN